MTQEVAQDGRFASGKVVEHLRAQILSGQLAPGARIRQEEVAAELGSSRLPVREALQILRHQGLVRLKPNSGASVMPFDPVECDLIYRVRQEVEPIVLAESVPRLSEQQVAELAELQEVIAQSRDVEEFLELDRRFHRLSYAGCSMESMLEMVERFWDTTQHYRRSYTQLLAGTRAVPTMAGGSRMPSTGCCSPRSVGVTATRPPTCCPGTSSAVASAWPPPPPGRAEPGCRRSRRLVA